MARGGNVKVRFSADTTDLQRGTTRAERSLGRLEKSGAKSFDRLKTTAMVAGPAIAGGLGLIGKASIEAATDVNEQLNKVNVVFGRNAAAVAKWADTTATAFGTSKREALAAAGTFGNLLTTLGFAQPKAARMSQEFVELAADMASFNNSSPEVTLRALRSGLTGEIEPLRKFGVFVSAARVQQEAMRLGLAKTTEELTEQDKVQARYALILKDTSKQQGDFKRTSNDLANQQRILKAELSDISAELGKELLPVAKDVTTELVKFVKEMRTGTGAGGEFADTAGDVANVVKDIGGFLKDHPGLIKIAVGAWAAYKVASLAALAAVKVQTFRKVFAKSVPVAAEQGAAAGAAYSTAFNTSATTGVGKMAKSGSKFLVGLRALGTLGGVALAGAILGKSIAELANAFGANNDEPVVGRGRPLPFNRIGAVPVKPPSVGRGGGGLTRRGREPGGLPRRPRPIDARGEGSIKGGLSAGVGGVGSRSGGFAATKAAGNTGIIALGRQLQAEGYIVGEHPAFGGVAPVHVQGSYHYQGMAIDVNGGPGGEPGSLDALYARLQGRPGVVELLWRVTGHFDHLHVAVAGAVNPLGGVSAGRAGEGVTGGRMAPAGPSSAERAFNRSQAAGRRSARQATRRARREWRRGAPGGFRPPGGTGPTRGMPGFGRIGDPILTPENTDPWVWNETARPAEVEPPSKYDFLSARLAQAQLTTGTSDDLAVLNDEFAQRLADYNAAASGADSDPRAVYETATALKSVQDAIDGLKEATVDNTAALLELERTEKDKLALALRVSQTETGVLKGALVDLIAGGLGQRMALAGQTTSAPGRYAAGLGRL